MPQYIIASTGTETGKTFITCAICFQARKTKYNLHAIKPVVSGFIEGDNDSSKIASSIGLPPKSIPLISPWRFKPPVAPYLAAEMENKVINYDRIVDFCKSEMEKHENLLIESAGGIMSPITRTKLCLDIAKDLKLPIVLVVGSYLGTISHSLTAIEAIQRNALFITLLVVNQQSRTMPDPSETATFLKEYTKLNVHKQNATNGDNPWEHADKLLQLLF